MRYASGSAGAECPAASATETIVLISPELNAAFNEQIGHEFGASLQYISISAHFSQRQLQLLAKLFLAQAEEEKTHALKFIKCAGCKVSCGSSLSAPAG